MAVDFTKPLAIFCDEARDNYDSVRVIATNRIAPGGYNYVILALNERAMFGPEEFCFVATAEGKISGQGLNFRHSIRNVEPEPRDPTKYQRLADALRNTLEAKKELSSILDQMRDQTGKIATIAEAFKGHRGLEKRINATGEEVWKVLNNEFREHEFALEGRSLFIVVDEVKKHRDVDLGLSETSTVSVFDPEWANYIQNLNLSDDVLGVMVAKALISKVMMPYNIEKEPSFYEFVYRYGSMLV